MITNQLLYQLSYTGPEKRVWRANGNSSKWGNGWARGGKGGKVKRRKSEKVKGRRGKGEKGRRGEGEKGRGVIWDG